MSDKNILKSSLVVGASVMALTLGACASSGNSSSNSRYGNVYDYESGGNCNTGASCGAVAAPPVETRYGSGTGTVIGGQPVSPGVVYMDCSQVSGINCGAPVAPAPAPVYSPPPSTHQTTTSYSDAVSCPSGTTAAGDGTCMMKDSGSYNMNSSTTSGGTVDCPSGTKRTNEGTCMVSSEQSNITVQPTTGYVPPVNYTAPVYQPIRK